MQLTNTPAGNYTPAPEGVHSAVCIDLIDLGIQPTQFGDKHKLRLVFEVEEKKEDGKPFTISKSFTASLNPKATLAQFLAKWRGKPIVEGETIDLKKLIGASATLVVSHQTNDDGKTFAGIDAVSKPTKKLSASGTYDAATARQRITENAAKYGRPSAAPAPKDNNDDVIASFPKAPSRPAAAVAKDEDNMPF